MGGDEEIGFDVSRPATLHNGGAKLAQVSSASLKSQLDTSYRNAA